MAEKNPLKYEGGAHRPFAAGDTVSPESLALASRILPGGGFTITPLSGGRIRIDNDCCTEPPQPSIHNAFASVNPGSDAEGSTFTFTVNLLSSVTVEPLVVELTFSGTEQDAHSYPSPVNITIPVGALNGAHPVTTINDNAGGPNTTLTATITPNPRLASTASPVSATVVSQDTASVAFVLPDGVALCCAVTDVDASLSESSVVFAADGSLVMRAHTFDTCDQTSAGTWVTGTFNPAQYEVRFTASAYTATGPTVVTGAAAGVWHPLGATVSFNVSGTDPAATPGDTTSTLQGIFEVRRISDAAVLATSAAVNLRAFNGPGASESDCGFLEASASPNPLNMDMLGPGTLAGNTVITATGGDGSYSYSTSWLSGGTGITLTDTMSFQPGVTSTWDVNGPLTRFGTARTVVSDGTSTVNVDWSVTLTWDLL